MRFKSKIITHFFMYDNPESQINEVFQNLDEKFSFDKTHVLFSKKQRKKFGYNLHLNPFDARITDGVPYILHKEKVARGYKYDATISNFKVGLALDKFNQLKLNWMFRNYWIQNEKSNWLKTSLITSLLSVATYFVGQKIGFNKGYSDGLKEGKGQVPKSTQSRLPIGNTKKNAAYK